jgi:hypothetical protein
MTTLEELKAQYRREVSDSSPAALPSSLDEQAEVLLIDQRDGGSRQVREWTSNVADPYPLTLRFPADAKIATIEGRWRRLPDGTIEATFNTREELAWALAAAGCGKPEVMEVLQ